MEIYINDIPARLEALAEPDFRDFSSALVPGCGKMLGVRLPKLRALARDIAAEYGSAAVPMIGDSSFEETMLRGMVIGCLRLSPRELIPLVRDFVPCVGNWSHCDSFVTGLRRIRLDRAAYIGFLEPYFCDPREFYSRFALVSALSHYSVPEYADWALNLILSVSNPGYYSKMAKAWALSEFVIRVPEIALPRALGAKLEPDVRKMFVRKLRDSFRVPDSVKAMF